MFFEKSKEKSLNVIKINHLKRTTLLRQIDCYADDKYLPAVKAFVLRTVGDIEKNLFFKNNNNCFFIENFSNTEVDFLNQNYDLVFVKINFEIVKIIKNKEVINKQEISTWTPTNLWILQKGMINFFQIESSKKLSIHASIINKNTI